MAAALFDLDGTLVDNMAYHARAWMRLCERHGIPARLTQFQREFAGKKNAEIIETLLGPGVPRDKMLSLADEKETFYRELYAGHVGWVPGAHALMLQLRAARIPIALGTAAPPANRVLVLGELGAHDLFDAIVGGEQVHNGKPAPDIFLAAAAALGVSAERCVVFEDAVNGVLAGKAAGCFTVGICTSEPPDILAKAGADAAARDFTTLPSSVFSALGVAPALRSG